MKDDVKAVLAAAVFLTLVFGVVSLDLRPLAEGSPPQVQTLRAWERGPQGGEDPATIADFVFGAYALPFEVLSVVLLVALVAAVFLAKPDRPSEGKP